MKTRSRSLDDMKVMEAEFKLIRSKRKTISLEINKALDVIIRAPLTFPNQDISDFYHKHIDWIETKKQKLIERENSKPKFIEDESFYFLGKSYPLTFADIATNFEFNDAFIVNQNHKDNARAVLLHWFKQQANLIIPKKVEEFRSKFNFNQIRIKDVKSYWGLCNKDNDLHFNWRVIMAPMETIEYLIIHECAHTVVKNHSKRFWALVAKHCPEYKVHERWLKKHSELVYI